MVSSPSFGYAVFADFGLKINGETKLKKKEKNHTKQNKTEQQNKYHETTSEISLANSAKQKNAEHCFDILAERIVQVFTAAQLRLAPIHSWQQELVGHFYYATADKGHGSKK